MSTGGTQINTFPSNDCDELYKVCESGKIRIKGGFLKLPDWMLLFIKLSHTPESYFWEKSFLICLKFSFLKETGWSPSSSRDIVQSWSRGSGEQGSHKREREREREIDINIYCCSRTITVCQIMLLYHSNWKKAPPSHCLSGEGKIMNNNS